MTDMGITLNPDERALFDAIRWTGRNDTVAEARADDERVVALYRGLRDRRAIPDARLLYFTDPELNVGSTRSRKEWFEVHGNVGRDILTHGNFLKFLRYFICGPDLPQSVITRFRDLAGRPFPEMEDMRVYVRASVRELGPRTGADLGEEFFKLALESGLDRSDAKRLRSDAKNAASSVRRRR